MKTLTFEFSVTAVEESLEASTESPLTEASLHGSIITLTLRGRQFVDEWDIGDAVSVSGIDGVTVESFRSIETCERHSGNRCTDIPRRL